MEAPEPRVRPAEAETPDDGFDWTDRAVESLTPVRDAAETVIAVAGDIRAAGDPLDYAVPGARARPRSQSRPLVLLCLRQGKHSRTRMAE